MRNSSTKVKKIVGHDVTPSYPNFFGRITINTYKKKHLRRVISSKGRSTAVYSHK